MPLGSKCRVYRPLHFGQSGPRGFEGVSLPICGIEQFKRQHGRRVDAVQIPQDLFQGRHAVARIDSVTVGNRLPRWGGWIVVQVNNLDRLTAEQSQTEEAGLPFVKVKHIG